MPPPRLTMADVGRWLVQDGLELNGRLPRTVLLLFRTPGEAIRSYLAGDRQRLSSPVKYLPLAMALYALLYVQMGIIGETVSSLMAAESRVPEEVLTGILSTHLKVLLACSVPMMTVASKMFFRRAGLNVAEHLTFNAFVYAQQLLLFVMVVPALSLAGIPYGIYSKLYACANFGYYAYAASSFFRVGRVSGAIRGGLAFGLSMLGFGLILGIIAGIQSGLLSPP